VVDVGFGSAGWCSRASSNSCPGVWSCRSSTRARIVGDADGLAPVARSKHTFESVVDPWSARAHWPLQRRFCRPATWQPPDCIALAPSGPIRRVFQALRPGVLIEVGGLGSYITACTRKARAMSVAQSHATPALVALAPPPEKRPSLLRQILSPAPNEFESIPRIAFERPIWEWKSLFGHNFVVSDPAGVKRVLLDNVANYPKTQMETEMLGAIVGEGLLVSQGEKWKSHRRLMSPSFDFRSILSYAPAMVAAAEGFTDAWSQRNDGAPVDIAEEMTNLTLRVISNTMFSADGEILGELVDSSLRRMGEAIDFNVLDIIPVIGPPRMKRKMASIHANFLTMDATMQKLVQARGSVEGRPPHDLLDRLIAARDGETGTRLTNDEVRDEVVIIFLAGHDTTALALTYTWYLLSQHPAVESKLHAELARVLAGRAPPMTISPIFPTPRW